MPPLAALRQRNTAIPPPIGAPPPTGVFPPPSSLPPLGSSGSSGFAKKVSKNQYSLKYSILNATHRVALRPVTLVQIGVVIVEVQIIRISTLYGT